MSPARPLLGPRQLQALALAAQGYRRAEIANRMFISPFTVKNHFQVIFERLEAHTQAEAVAKAIALGLLSRPERADAAV